MEMSRLVSSHIAAIAGRDLALSSGAARVSRDRAPAWRSDNVLAPEPWGERFPFQHQGEASAGLGRFRAEPDSRSVPVHVSPFQGDSLAVPQACEVGDPRKVEVGWQGCDHGFRVGPVEEALPGCCSRSALCLPDRSNCGSWARRRARRGSSSTRVALTIGSPRGPGQVRRRGN